MADDPGTVDHVADLVARDRAVVWHPYAPMPAAMPAVVVDTAAGVRLQLADGRTAIDAMSSWWAAIHGYRHPVLDAAVHAQVDRMAHVMFGGLTHRPAIELAELLVEITPAGLDHVFLADSGSVAVEVAVKMARQHWLGRGRPARHRLLTCAAATTATRWPRCRSAIPRRACTTCSATRCRSSSSRRCRSRASARPSTRRTSHRCARCSAHTRTRSPR